MRFLWSRCIPGSWPQAAAARLTLPQDRRTGRSANCAEQKRAPRGRHTKRATQRGRDGPMHYYFAGHGYASIRVDIRGAGDSEGLTFDEYTERELDDAVAVITWLAAQPWCNGSVGIFGISWGGFNSLQVAARAP